MSRLTKLRRRAAPVPVRLFAAALALTAWGCADVAAPTAPQDPAAGRRDDFALRPEGRHTPLTVYTQNVYLGGDTGPLFTLDFSDIPAVLQATNVFWAQVQSSDVPGRAAAIVDEIEARRPEVVGLQEVVGFAIVDATTGQIVDGIDLLASIEGEIAGRGLPYEVVRVQENTSGSLPLTVGATGITRALAFTDRVVALRRTDVTVTDSDQGTYQAAAPLGPITLTRGWIRVSFEHRGVPVNFVTTHLETQGLAQVQAGQVDELLGSIVDGLDGVTVLAGDLNSDAEASPGAESWTPTYGRLLDAGFVDAWARSGHARRDHGFTCCQDSDLRNEASTLDQRIDFVLLRRGGHGWTRAGFVPGSLDVDVVGDEIADRTDGSDLWPSDHSGLVAGVRLLPFPGRAP